MSLKKRFVTALLVGAIGVSLCATGAMAARTKDFVPIEEVWTEDTGILIYCSYYNDPEKVAMDSNGKPLAVGISKAAIARTKGEYVAPAQKEPGWWMDEAWWQEGFSEDGLKQVAGSGTLWEYNFTTAPDGTVYYRDDNNGGVLTILHPDGTVETVEGINAKYLAVAPDGKVWFRDANHSNNLASYDPTTGNVEYVAGTYADIPAIAPDGKVWFRDYNHSNNLASYDPTTGNVEYVAGTTAITPSVAPDGKVWFGDYNHSNNLASYDPTTGNIEYVAGTSAGYTAVDPDGKVWFRDYLHSNNLASYDPVTRNITYISGTNVYNGTIHADDAGNVWFPDHNNGDALTVYSPEKDQTREW